MSAGKRSCYVAVPTLSAVCYLLHMYLFSVIDHSNKSGSCC